MITLALPSSVIFVPNMLSSVRFLHCVITGTASSSRYRLFSTSRLARWSPQAWTREDRITMLQSFFMEKNCRPFRSLIQADSSIAALPFEYEYY